MFALWKNSYVKLKQCFKKQRHHFANKGPYSQSYGFSSSHVWMWELNHKEGWTLKNWCFLTVEGPLDCKEIKLVNPTGNQPWLFTGISDAEAPILWPPDMKSRLFGKDPDAGKVWRQEEKEMTEDEMVGWAHRFNGHELGQILEMVRDREVWHAAVHGVAKSRTRLGDWTATMDILATAIDFSVRAIFHCLLLKSWIYKQTIARPYSVWQ